MLLNIQRNAPVLWFYEVNFNKLTVKTSIITDEKNSIT